MALEEPEAMAGTELIRVDKLASVTVNLKLEKEISVSAHIEPKAGNVCIVRALEEKRVYDRLELVTGRMAKISKGDIIAGVLGQRRALQGFAGVVPEKIKKGDVLHVLNLGGIIGKAISFNRDYGQPLKVEVLGTAVKDGKVLNIKDGAKKTASHLSSSVPLVVVCGTSMNSGKTEALSRIIQVLTWRGKKVCAGKVTGISALKDVLNMEDHGAVKALSFIDFGYPSTVGLKAVPFIAKGILNELAQYHPEVIMLELGDGLLGEYGVMDFYRDEELLEGISCNIACAIDPVGAWGMKEILEGSHIPIHLVSGPVTDNTVGLDFVKKTLGLAGLNALSQQEELGIFVEKMIGGA
jgi:hypothetical protein